MFLVYFIAVLGKATTLNDQILPLSGELEPQQIINLISFKCFALSQIQFRDSFETEKQMNMALEYRQIRIDKI